MGNNCYTPLDRGSSSRPRHDDILIRALLRHYANNLRRSWRNAPHQAFVDATIQAGALAVLVLVYVASLSWIVLSRVIFPALAHLGHEKNGSLSGGAIIVVLGIIVIISKLLDSKFGPYEFIPGVEKAYDSDRDRRFVIYYYCFGIAIIILGGLTAVFVGRSFGVQG